MTAPAVTCLGVSDGQVFLLVDHRLHVVPVPAASADGLLVPQAARVIQARDNLRDLHSQLDRLGAGLARAEARVAEEEALLRLLAARPGASGPAATPVTAPAGAAAMANRLAPLIAMAELTGKAAGSPAQSPTPGPASPGSPA